MGLFVSTFDLAAAPGGLTFSNGVYSGTLPVTPFTTDISTLRSMPAGDDPLWQGYGQIDVNYGEPFTLQFSGVGLTASTTVQYNCGSGWYNSSTTGWKSLPSASHSFAAGTLNVSALMANAGELDGSGNPCQSMRLRLKNGSQLGHVADEIWINNFPQ
jgi:hypothetical protein